MTLEQQKAEIMAAYPSAKWAEAVACMSPEQITAIFLRLKNSKKKPTVKRVRVEKGTTYYCVGCNEKLRFDNPSLLECPICGTTLHKIGDDDGEELL